MKPSPWWQSKTIWLNAIALTLELLALADKLPGAESLSVYIPTIAAMLNVALRFVTNAPIAGTPAAAEAQRVIGVALAMPPHTTVGELHRVVEATTHVPTPREAAAIVEELPAERGKP